VFVGDAALVDRDLRALAADGRHVRPHPIVLSRGDHGLRGRCADRCRSSDSRPALLATVKITFDIARS
jgi:hypothetical protein